MSSIPETDQWKLGGDCSKCRRKKYCSKGCSARDRRVRQLVAAKVSELLPALPLITEGYGK